MKAFITGGSGSVGMALTAYLLGQDIPVVWLCRMDSPKSRTALSLLKENALFSAVNLPLEAYDSVSDEELKKLACKPEEEGLFFHLAWGGTFGAMRNDEELQKRNVQAVLSALRLAGRLGCKAFVGAGSQAEYGPVYSPLRGDTPMHPVTAYGKAKKEAGEAALALGDMLGIRTTWCRILSVYGPWDTQGTMVSTAIRLLSENEPAAFTHGKQIWDYLYSEDAAGALYVAALHSPGGAYPLGSGEGRPLKEYIQMIRDAVNPEGKLLFGAVPGPEEPYPVLCADLSEFTEITGFRPSFSFEEGIEKTVRWYRDCVSGRNHV